MWFDDRNELNNKYDNSLLLTHYLTHQPQSTNASLMLFTNWKELALVVN